MKRQNVFLERPWIDSEGNLIHDEYLQILGQYWDVDTWDRYLKEKIEVPQRELVTKNWFAYQNFPDTTEIEELIHDVAENSTFVTGNSYAETILMRALKELTENQQKVIYFSFWKNLNNQEIADRLDVSGEAVRRTKVRALKALKKKLSKKIKGRN